MPKIKINKIYKFVIFIFILIIVGRGFFELLFEKKIAFLTQALSIIVFILLSLGVFGIKLRSKYFSIQIIAISVFLLAAITSIVITIVLEHGGAPLFYSAIMVFLIVVFVLISAFTTSQKSILDIGNTVLVLILILFTVAVYEQVTETLMPGAWWYNGKIRPASITGSKQHYSIILSILALFIFQYWLSLKRAKFLFGFLLGVMGVVASLTRSGAMILALTFLFYSSHRLYHAHLIKINPKILVVLGSFLVLSILFSVLYFDVGFFLERVLSSVDTNSTGNSERVDAWLLGLDLLFSSNILFGEYTGVVTNATRTVTSNKSFVVESGTLQMILNFGLIGFSAFYLILFNVYRRIKRQHIFLFFTLLSCLISTIVYQSVETIPFIVLLSFIPLISSDITALTYRQNFNS